MVKYILFTKIHLLIIVSEVVRWLKCNKWVYVSENNNKYCIDIITRDK